MVDTASRTTSTTSSKHTAAVPAKPAGDQVAAAIPAAPADPQPESPRVDVERLGRQLLGTWADIRLAARERAAGPDFQRIEGQSMAEHRERVLGQLKLLVEAGAVHRAFPKEFGGKDDHGGNIAAFEELVLADPSLQIKAGVQWGLFGAAVLHLGTEYHHRTFLPDAMSLKVPGAFAMTETGHGSDVAAIATTATYDEATQEFVIDTPFRGAWKDYLGNAALHGTAAVVFAQLITKGVNHGVHAFYVPLRNANGGFLEGVGGEDDGLKGGLNGIDNGRLHFTNVRVPRVNLLNRYGSVAEDGTYSSPIASPGRRFFTMLGTLVQGRVSLDGASTSAAAIALAIAITYGNQRRQFNAGSDTEEEVLLDYQRHQRRLIPKLATTYAQVFAHDEFLVKFDAVFSGEADTDDDRQDLETIAAALKPLSTWHALETLQEAREATGGAGFLAENRLVGLRQDVDIYVTFEGDNNVLLQLVAKRLLTDFSRAVRQGGCGCDGPVRRAADRGSGLPRHRSAPPRADGRGLRVDRALRHGAPGREDAARASHRPGRDHDRRDRRSPARRPQAAEGGCRGPLQPQSERAHRGRPRPRGAAAVGGVHPRPRADLRPGHEAGAHVGPRPVRSRPDREAPRVVPHPRPALAAARASP